MSDIWADSTDAPCSYCGATPCHALIDGCDPVCDNCAQVYGTEPFFPIDMEDRGIE
jgi:hypothetical protein